MWKRLLVVAVFLQFGFVCIAEKATLSGDQRRLGNEHTSEQHLGGRQLTETQDGSVTVNFSKYEDGTDVHRGDVIDEKKRFPGSVVIKAQRAGRRGYGDGMIFDVHNVSGNDFDLANFGFLGNLFIISADNDPSDPDDAGVGGFIEVEFLRYPVKLNFIRFIDVDRRGSGLTLFDVDGNKIRGEAIPAMADGGQKLLTYANAVGVRSIRIRFAGSGAIDDINFFPPAPAPPPSPTRLRATLVHKFELPLTYEFAVGLAFRPKEQELAILVDVVTDLLSQREVRFYNYTTLDNDEPPVLIRTAMSTKSYFPQQLVFSPDGTKLAGPDNFQLVLWTEEDFHTFPSFVFHGRNSPKFRSASWFPDNKRLAAILREGDVFIWDTTTKDTHLVNATVFENVAHLPSLSGTMDVSPNGQYFAIGNQTQYATLELCPTCDHDSHSVLVYSTENGSLEAILAPTHSTPVTNVKYSPDGTKLASTGRNHRGDGPKGELYIFHASTLELLWTFQPKEQDGFEGLAWSPDSRYIACHIPSLVEGEPQLIYVFDTVNGGDPVLVMNGSFYDISSELAWSPDGKYLAVRNYEPHIYRIQEEE